MATSVLIESIEFQNVQAIASRLLISNDLPSLDLELSCDVDAEILLWNTFSLRKSIDFTVQAHVDEDDIDGLSNMIRLPDVERMFKHMTGKTHHAQNMATDESQSPALHPSSSMLSMEFDIKLPLSFLR